MRSRTVTGFWLAVLLGIPVITTAGDLRVVEAARQGTSEEVRSLLGHRAEVNQSEAGGATALHWAAYRDELETAKLLIVAGGDVNAANDYGITPLWLACANGSSSMVDLLLKAGADANSAQWSGATPLMMCAKTGNLLAVKSLLNWGANVNNAERSQSQTALMWAAAWSHPDIVRALLQHKADVNAHTKGGFTALMFAAQQGDLASARELLDAGADINATTNDQAMWVGDTPLLIASASGHETFSIYLLQRGANPNAADAFGYTALHFSLMKGLSSLTGMRLPDFGWSTYIYRPDMTELVKALLAHGANPNARITKRWGGNRLLSVMLNDPDKFSVSEVGETPFLVAAMTHDVQIMRMLVAAGADPNLASEGGTTPLMIAAGLTRRRSTGSGGGSAGRLPPKEATKALNTVKYLVGELGANVNAANNHGLTALDGAAYNGSNDIIRYLIAKGANVNAEDASGQTALDKAMDSPPKLGIKTNGDGHDIFVPYTYWKDTAELLVKLGGNSASGRVAVAQKRGASASPAR